jgi:TolB-like protein
VTDTPTEREVSGAWGLFRRRKVVQWGLGYAAAAWTLLQVIEYLAETYAWPPAIRRIAIPALALGSLLVLVLAWYHGEKGEQKVSRPEAAILAALMALVSGSLWWYGSRLDESAWVADSGLPNIKHVVPTDAPSVAVLPFVNMSSDPEQEYFADGLSEETLNALARIPGLFVPARTSSFQFKGKSADIAAFAARLGVATVLEGSVRKSGNRVRITAQLVNARDGFHLWSQTFDRDLKDIFAIQEEIARAIADALKIRLTAQQKLASALAPPTTNMDAYQEFLLGRFEVKKGGPKAVENAMAHLQKAVALDPQFADAYAELARVALDIGNEYLPTKEGRALSEEYLKKAQALAPDRPLVLNVTGMLLQFDGEYDDSAVHLRDEHGQLRSEAKARLERALDCYDRSLAGDPAQAGVVMRRARLLQELGRNASAFAATEEALKRDPLSVEALWTRIRMLDARSRRAESTPLIERLTAIDPARGHLLQSRRAFENGDAVAGVRHLLLRLDAEDNVNPGAIGELAFALGRIGWRDEAFNAAKLSPDADLREYAYWGIGEYRRAAEAIRPAVTKEQWAYACDLGHALYLVPDIRQAQSAFTTCWEHGTPMLGVGGMRLLMAADVERRLGNDAQARRYFSWLDEQLQRAIADGYLLPEGQGPDATLHAMYYAYGGRDDQALKQLVQIVTIDPFSAADLRRYPMFAELVKHPEFRTAEAQGRPRMERQRQEVRRMLCGPNPVSKRYKPLPQTCALAAQR